MEKQKRCTHKNKYIQRQTKQQTHTLPQPLKQKKTQTDIKNIKRHKKHK